MQQVSLPWKNGAGTTDEILVLPPGAGRDAFDLRISSATIAEPAGFSAFPGVERWITVIEGAGVRLDFDESPQVLHPLMPCRFDSALTPVGQALGGTARVVNVMAARAAWTLGAAKVLAGSAELDLGEDEQAAIFIIAGEWRITGAGTELRLGPRDFVLPGDGQFRLEAGAEQPRALLVPMARAG
ncbi:MAG: HutD family protein [Gemmobacter sp.]|nr:HutD family protein [Gemmobacter sp.]